MIQKPYEVIDVVQGTDTWLALRREHVTASHIPALLGICPYSCWNDILTEKLTGQEREVNSYKQILFQKGHKAEAAARSWLQEHTGLLFPPAVVTSTVVKRLMASLDGLNEAESIGLESKYMGSKKLQLVKEGIIQPHHFMQIQAQLLVTGAKKFIYFATDDSGDSAMMDIEPDAQAFDEIVGVVNRFIQALATGELPPPKVKRTRKAKEVV